MKAIDIIGATWWTPPMSQPGARGPVCIGAVAIKVEEGWKAYMGIGQGDDELADAFRIAQMGAKLTRSQARGLFPRLIDKHGDYIS